MSEADFRGITRAQRRVALRRIARIVLAEFLGIARHAPDQIARTLAAISPPRRTALEQMARVAQQLRDWRAGTGPKPMDAILCARRGR